MQLKRLAEGKKKVLRLKLSWLEIDLLVAAVAAVALRELLTLGRVEVATSTGSQQTFVMLPLGNFLLLSFLTHSPGVEPKQK